MAWHGMAWHCMVWHGMAWHVAWHALLPPFHLRCAQRTHTFRTHDFVVFSFFFLCRFAQEHALAHNASTRAFWNGGMALVALNWDGAAVETLLTAGLARRGLTEMPKKPIPTVAHAPTMSAAVHQPTWPSRCMVATADMVNAFVMVKTACGSLSGRAS